MNCIRCNSENVDIDGIVHLCNKCGQMWYIVDNRVVRLHFEGHKPEIPFVSRFTVRRRYIGPNVPPLTPGIPTGC